MSFYKEVPGRKTTLESTLKFDIEPKVGSMNPVTSDGVNKAIGDTKESVDEDVQDLQDQIDDIAEKAGSGYIPKGESTVATLNALSGQENGELYTMTDAGTLTDGSLAVVAGDTVAWDATNSVWYKAMDYAPMQYGTDQVKNLPTSITAFRTGDVIPVDGPSGTAKMSKDDLLKETAQNALAGNVAPAFDSTKPNDEGGYAYYTGDNVTYDGDNYVFVLNHKSGAWNPSEVEQKPLSETINLQGVGQAVQEWLDEHPEVTTTVEDGSITEQKLAESLKLKTIKEYVTPEMFGAVGDGVTDDSVAIQDAVNYLESRRGGIILFDTKTYRVDNSININDNGDDQAIEFIGCGIKNVSGGVPQSGSYIASYCLNTICIKSGTNYIHFDGLNFSGMLSRSLGTKLFSVYGTSGFVARLSFRNMSIRSFDYAFDLIGGSQDGYVDGSEFYNIHFNTVNKCIRAKHLEVCHIELCTAEPFLHYFVWAKQSNTLEIKNCVIRSLSNASRSNPLTPIGIVLDGVSSYGKHICVHDCIFENSDVCILSNNQKLKVYNIQYITDVKPFQSAFIFGRWEGGNSDEISLENITTTYEDGTDHYDIEVIKSEKTLNLFPYIEEGVTYYEQTFTISASIVRGLRVVGWIPTNNISGSVAGVKLFFFNLARSFLKWVNGRKVYFVEADDTSPTNPDGESWGFGDIICQFPTQAIDNWIGKIYTQRFGFVPFGQPIIAVTKKQATTYKSLTQGVSVYYKQDNIPLWSNGTEWVMHDGVPFTTPRRGASTERPTSGIYNGFMFFDTTLVKPIWYNSGNWVDATGTQV